MADYDSMPTYKTNADVPSEEVPVSVQARGQVADLRERASHEAQRFELAAKKFAKLSSEAKEAANTWRTLLAGDAPGMDEKSEY